MRKTNLYMRAMVMESPGEALMAMEVARPEPGVLELLIKVKACGVCRTDLHIVDGDLQSPKLPLIPGHEIVGEVVSVGDGADSKLIGKRLGVPWLGQTCGDCLYCKAGRDNLCDNPAFTGYQLNGGYAEYTVARQEYCLPIPEEYTAVNAAPLLCAGLIGFRALGKTGGGQNVGLYGFGAAAHIIAQVAVYQGRQVYAFTRPGDWEGQDFARALGAVWAGGSDQLPPQELDSAIIFAPAGHLIPQALKAVRKGGAVVCAGIHMSEIPAFPYHLIWGERSICSVANLTREDGIRFFEIAPKVPVATVVETFALEQANSALQKIREGEISGAAVLVI